MKRIRLELTPKELTRLGAILFEEFIISRPGIHPDLRGLIDKVDRLVSVHIYGEK